MERLIMADEEDTWLPGSVREAHRRAEAVLLEAHAEADRLLRRAEIEAHEIIARARNEAGFQAREEMAHALLQASAARDQALADARNQVIAVSLAAAEKILGTSIQANPALIENVVRPLLLRVRRARRIELRLHPEDAVTLERSIEALASEAQTAVPVRIEADRSLRRGSCVLVSDLGVLDARLETRMELVARALDPLIDLPAPSKREPR